MTDGIEDYLDFSEYVENKKENIETGRWSVRNEKSSTKSTGVNVTTYFFISKSIVVHGLQFSFVI